MHTKRALSYFTFLSLSHPLLPSYFFSSTKFDGQPRASWTWGGKEEKKEKEIEDTDTLTYIPEKPHRVRKEKRRSITLAHYFSFLFSHFPSEFRIPRTASPSVFSPVFLFSFSFLLWLSMNDVMVLLHKSIWMEMKNDKKNRMRWRIKQDGIVSGVYWNGRKKIKNEYIFFFFFNFFPSFSDFFFFLQNYRFALNSIFSD